MSARSLFASFAPRLDFETAHESHPMDAWATITLVVVASVLSVRKLQGIDLGYLVVDDSDWPRTTWNLFTTTLLHGSWLHLVFNLLWTFRFGVLLEAMFGTLVFSLIVVVLAVGSSAAQFAFLGPCIGLSGIGYGLFGLLWTLGRWHPRCRGMLHPKVIEGFGIWFLVCIAATWLDILPVANIAHGVGFLLGALLGWSLCAQGALRFKRAATLPGLLLIIGLTYVPALRDLVNRTSGHLFARAYAAHEAGRLEEALGLYAQVLARREEPASAHNSGLILRELERYPEALSAFDRALAVKPHDTDTLCSRGNVLRILERDAEALASFERAAELAPEDLGVLFPLARTQLALGHFEAARATCDDALAVEPGQPDFTQMRELALLALGRG